MTAETSGQQRAATAPLLDQRVALVTGASSGIGLATAIATARQGWTTVATIRDTSRADALRAAASQAGVSLDVRRMDVTDQATIDACVGGVVDDYGALHALVNNAGSAHVATVEMDDMAEFRRCLEVNFFGVVQVTRAAMPHLRLSAGRVVTVSSVGGVVGQPFNEAYCAAKFAVEGFLEALAPVAAAVGVSVAVVEPGAVASRFIDNAGLDPATMLATAGPYAEVLRRYLDRTMSQFDTGAQPAAAVAEVIVTALDAQPLPFRLQTSQWSQQFVATKLADVDGSRVQELTRSWIAG